MTHISGKAFFKHALEEGDQVNVEEISPDNHSGLQR